MLVVTSSSFLQVGGSLGKRFWWARPGKSFATLNSYEQCDEVTDRVTDNMKNGQNIEQEDVYGLID